MQVLQDKRVAVPRCPMPRREMHLDRLPPQRAGDLAFRIFCTPELSQHRSPDHDLLTARARFHLRHARWQIVPTPVGDVQTYVYEPDGPARGTLMLVHGWTSEAAFMTAFVEPLRRSGYRVIAFDFPAHGMSPSRRTNLADCARAMLSVCDHHGPIDGVVAHSFGGFVSLLVAEGGPPLDHRHPINRFVLIACPNELSEVTSSFGRSLRLSGAAQRVYEQHLERIGHRPVAKFSSAALLRGIEADASVLIIHGRKDDEVGFHNAEEIAAATPSARVMPFDDLGHRNVLFAPPVFRAVMSEFVPRASAATSTSNSASSSCGQEMKASA